MCESLGISYSREEGRDRGVQNCQEHQADMMFWGGPLGIAAETFAHDSEGTIKPREVERGFLFSSSFSSVSPTRVRH